VNHPHKEDISMAAASSAQQVSSEIVGILEGFGLLNDLSDLPQAPAGTDAAAADSAAGILLQGMAQDAAQTGTLDKYARMLSKDQLSRLPEDMQQAILKAVGDYLGSFESTNNKTVQNTVAQVSAQDTAENAALGMSDTAALPDKIASLLLKLKAVSQDVKPAKSTLAVDSTNIITGASPANTEAEGLAGAEFTESVRAVSMQTKTAVQTGKTMAQTDEGTFLTDKSKIAVTDELPQQASKTNMPVQTSPQAQVIQETDAVQTKAEAPQTGQADFVKDNVMRIVDKLHTEVSGGKYDFDVELKPDFLGKVNIKLTMENGEIRMQIKTDDMGVKGMFAEQASSMQAVLKDKGIAVTNIDITYQSQMQTGDGRQAFRQNDNGGKKQSSRTHVSLEQIAGTGVFETMTEITGYTHAGSSVEYLA